MSSTPKPSTPPPPTRTRVQLDESGSKAMTIGYVRAPVLIPNSSWLGKCTWMCDEGGRLLGLCAGPEERATVVYVNNAVALRDAECCGRTCVCRTAVRGDTVCVPVTETGAPGTVCVTTYRLQAEPTTFRGKMCTLPAASMTNAQFLALAPRLPTAAAPGDAGPAVFLLADLFADALLGLRREALHVRLERLTAAVAKLPREDVHTVLRIGCIEVAIAAKHVTEFVALRMS